MIFRPIFWCLRTLLRCIVIILLTVGLLFPTWLPKILGALLPAALLCWLAATISPRPCRPRRHRR
jgi:hypothetical protein